MASHEQVTLTTPTSADLGDILAGLDGLTVSSNGPQPSTVTWYDTRDGRLARWGASVEHRQGRGWTVVLPAADGQAWERHVRGAGTNPPDGVTNLTTAFTRRRKLEPVAGAQVTRHTLALRDAEGGTVAEIVDDEIRPDGDAGQPVRVVELTGGAAAGADTYATLIRQLGEAGLTERPPVSREQLARPATLVRQPEVVVPPIGSDASVEELLRYDIATWTLELLRYDPDIRMGHADEPVHQARVAARRLRWVLRAFGPFLQERWTERLRAELKWLDEHLAAVRDLDVTRLRLEGQATSLPDVRDADAARRLAGAYAGERRDAHRALLEAMQSTRYATLLDRLIAAAHAPALGARAGEPAATAGPEVVAGNWRRLRRAAKRVTGDPEDEALHTLRRRARQARYTAEAVAPVVGKQARRFARGAKQLQDELGEQHDAVISQDRLRTIAVARGRRLGEALAAGQLLVAEREAATSHAEAWPDRWKKLDRKRTRKWLAQP